MISEDWILLKNTIREKAENLDENLISILLDNDTTREKFFIKIKDVIVFDKKVFTNFKRINKDWEHKLERFNRDEKWDIKDNLIINSVEVIQSNFLNNSKIMEFSKVIVDELKIEWYARLEFRISGDNIFFLEINNQLCLMPENAFMEAILKNSSYLYKDVIKYIIKYKIQNPIYYPIY